MARITIGERLDQLNINYESLSGSPQGDPMFIRLIDPVVGSTGCTGGANCSGCAGCTGCRWDIRTGFTGCVGCTGPDCQGCSSCRGYFIVPPEYEPEPGINTIVPIILGVVVGVLLLVLIILLIVYFWKKSKLQSSE